MLYILIASTIVLVGLFIYSRLLRGRMEHSLTINHRGFLKSLKIDGAHKLKNAWIYGEGQEAIFSIEIDGKRRRYDSLFTDSKIMASLNDNELTVLCGKLIVLRRIFYIGLPICILIFLAQINT